MESIDGVSGPSTTTFKQPEPLDFKWLVEQVVELEKGISDTDEKTVREVLKSLGVVLDGMKTGEAQALITEIIVEGRQ
jgi:hypothetical protein